MARNRLIAFTVLAVAAMASAAAVAPPVSTVSTGTDLTGTVTTKELVLYSPPKNITSLAVGLPSTGLSINPDPEIGPLGTVLWAAIITGQYQFSASVCAAAVTAGGPAGIAVCAIAVATTAISAAFALYKVGNAKRSTDIHWFMDVDPGFSSTIGCGTACQLAARSPHNTWTPFANATTNGIAHTLSFYQNGNIKGIRAVQSGTKLPALNKRQEIITAEVVEGDTASGTEDWVGTLYWEDGAEAAWDGLSTYDDQAGTFLGDYMVDNDAEIACFDVSDDSGGGLGSIFLIDNQNEELLYQSDTTMEAVLGDCIDIMPAADQKKRVRKRGKSAKRV